ncbi:hypothetical protein CK203_116010 [Vitis vinifera]|uniref:Uncharacterized protein n=1 Tax=Vitis vinifera TaxID=29760 RepID=A0A438ER81_VITVI|nr:hypothetical protein CK203_116010 [Vitis vinifera]
MLLSTRVTPTFLLLVFRGRIPSRQTKIMILILWISLINPPTVFSPVSDLVSITYFLEPKSLLLESALEDRMIGKVYSRKKVVVPKLIQVHESELASRNKVLSLSLEDNLKPKYMYLVNELRNEVFILTAADPHGNSVGVAICTYCRSQQKGTP